MNLNQIQLVVNDQAELYREKDRGITRDINFKPYFTSDQIVIITGIRRSGKSTLMLQLAQNYSDYHYVTFDDERFNNFTLEDFQSLMTVLHKQSESKTIFFDEIQNILGWERFVRRVHDEGYKIFISGSNAHLLSSELATHLTGRYLKIALYPFSFAEVLKYQGIDLQNITTRKTSLILKSFDQYLNGGGFPEWIKTQNKETLQLIYEDILYRDIIARSNIQEIKSFKQLALYLSTNIAKTFSYHSVAKTVGIKSTTSVRNYLEFLQASYLMYELYKYDYSLKKQFISNKKIYSIDNGLRNCVSFSHSSDAGRLLENMVYIELRRRRKNIFFYKGKNECDFIIEESGKITQLIQVCYHLMPENKDREISGLMEASNQLNLHAGTIITYNEEDSFTHNGVKIKLVPAWKWLLDI